MDKRTCSVEGCGRPIIAWGWCNAHYRRWRAHGDPLADARHHRPTCSVEGCDGPHRGRGYCNAHYLRWRRYGDPLGAPERETRLCTVVGCGGKHVGLGLCNLHLLRLRKHGDPEQVRQPGEATYRRYSLNEAFFDEIATEAQAYWLGFITADGCVMRSERTNTLRVILAIKDTAHLERMNGDLGSDRPLAFRLGRPHPAVAATFDSWQLVQGLRHLGIHPNKSGTVDPWSGPEHLMPHYWRGLFDGDGSIFRCGGGWQLSIAGSESCVRSFGEWATGACGSSGKPRLHRGRTWTWRVGGGPKPQALAAALYDDATVYLQRKHELACELSAIAFPGSARRSAA